MPKSKMLWLDDDEMRLPPDRSGWTWVKTAQRAIDFLYMWQGQVSIASLDHDLGDAHYQACMFERNATYDDTTGFEVVKFLVEQTMEGHNYWPTEATHVHSWNSHRAQQMIDDINRFGPYTVPMIYTPYGESAWARHWFND